MSSGTAILKALWRNTPMLGMLGIGLMISTAWIWAPAPSRSDLTEVHGRLVGYSVELDNSWFEQHLARKRELFCLFRVTSQPGRFWNDAVEPWQAASIFAQPNADLVFYFDANRRGGRVNGDGRKSYGLTVDGVVIKSVGDAVDHDAAIAHFVLPLLGIVMIGIGGFWLYRDIQKMTSESVR